MSSDPQRYWPDGRPAPTPTLPVGAVEWRALLDHQARAVLGELRAEPLDADLPLIEQGFTSLLGLELRRALEVALARELPVSLLYDYPTLNRMAALFAGAVDVAPSRRAPAPALPGEFDFLDTLSPAELADLIEREVDQ